MKKLASLLLAGLMLFSFAGCSGGSGADTQPDASPEAQTDGETGAQGEFRVALECNYAPFNWTQMDDSNGAVAIGDGTYAGGYDVEIAKKLAEAMGKKLVIVKTEWDGLILSVNSGKCDAVIAGMSPTAERSVTVDFSDAYYESDLCIVVKKDGPYANATSLADFSGAKITGQLNTFHYTVIDQIEGVVKETAMDTFPAMIVAVDSGKVDGYISERPGAVSAVASNPTLTYVTFEEGKGFETSPEDTSIAVAIKKGNTELVEQVNEILAGISKEERLQLMDQAIANQPLSAE